MIDTITRIFKNKKVNTSKLVSFGFQQEKSYYIFHKVLDKYSFELTVIINENGEVSTRMTDLSTNELYTLHLVDSAVGNFVGQIRSEYEYILTEIANNCFDKCVFKSSQSESVIEYVNNKYQDKLEFLWDKFPDTAIWRRKDNKKWYGVIMTIPKNKLGIESDEIVEIIDLRILPDDLSLLVDNERIFLGYHMNKKHWITIIFDNGLPTEKIISLLDHSYDLAKK